MLSEESRQALATKLNDMVDLPFIGEAQEQALAEKLIDMCLEPIMGAAPDTERMQEMASESSEEEMQGSVKDTVVSKINKMINIPFANEEQEAVILGLIVDYFLKDQFEAVHSQLSG